jgi:uncharacterized protein (DUF924 family)
VETDWSPRVLDFWFGELSPKAWFEKSDQVDQRIRDRFLATHAHVSQDVSLDDLLQSADIALAAILVLDQFPRNMFRDTPRAFASDAKALALAERTVAAGLDRAVDAARRIFFYLPFEHSEAIADQDRSVALFEGLGDAEYLRYAHAHRDIVRRFGRFPHRNAILGRRSTPEELAFLQTPGSSF